MNIRHAVRIGSQIDCEIEHPEFGWIPTTTNPEDPETQQLYARIMAGEAGIIAPAVEPDPAVLLSQERERMNPSRLQCRLAMLELGVLEEAESAVAQADQVTREAWAAAQYFRRLSPLVIAMIAALDWTEEFTDDLCRLALTKEA